MSHPKLDAIDRRILAELQADGRITNVELSRRAKITAPPCLRRMRGLEKAGYIKGYHADLDARALGYEVTGFVFVGLAGQKEADLKAFEESVRRWPQVREVWEAFGGGKLAAPYNGSFELTAREPPFGWRLSNNDGAIGAIDRLDGGANHGLYAEFPSGRAATLAEQLMVLAPGHYRFSGRVKADRLPAGALYRWIATCFDADQPLVQVQTDTVKGWQSFAAEFDVPAQGCDAQWLRLGGTGGEGYEPASAWYDDLKLERLS